MLSSQQVAGRPDYRSEQAGGHRFVALNPPAEARVSTCDRAARGCFRQCAIQSVQVLFFSVTPRREMREDPVDSLTQNDCIGKSGHCLGGVAERPT